MSEVCELITTEIDAVDVHELTDAELDTVSGGVSDLGKYITKAVDEAISAC
jgi:bacteriocin-like protein